MKRLLKLLFFFIMVCGIANGIFVCKAEAALIWPVPGHTNLSQGYSSGSDGHNGIDISDSSIAGARVVAAMGGKVTTIYKCPDHHPSGPGDCNGFGHGIVIYGDDGRYYQYAHMQANSIPDDVYYGAYVSAGQTVGAVGQTGWATGNHLHFAISIGAYYNDSGIDPAKESYVSPHTHSYTSRVTKEPTCTAAGVRTYSCSCGSSYTETIPANGHKYKDTIVYPTATTQGYTLHTCSVCGSTTKDNYTDPIKEEGGWYYSAILPPEITSEDYTIEYKNYYEKIQTTSPGADWTNGGVAKTEWQNSGGPYISHTDLPTSDATILVSSIFYHFCGPNTGGYSSSDQTGNYVHYDWISASSVTEQYAGNDGEYPYYYLYTSDGNLLYCQSGVTCDGTSGTHGARGNTWYKENTYQNRVKVTQNKYTKESGWTDKKDSSATRVSYRYQEKHTHSYAPEITKEASCKEEGVITYTCPDCGDSYTEAIPKKTEHTWDEGIVSEPASCTKEGTRIYTCDICGETKEEPIEATGHTGGIEIRGQKDATCLEEGYTGDIHCATCGEKLSAGSVTEKSDHSWDDGVVTQEPTATTAGVRTYTCQVCRMTKTEEIPAGTETPTPTTTPEVTPTPTPEVTPTPETTPTPMPEVTPTPEATPAPEATPTPEATPAPETTPTPEATPTSEVTPTPEVKPTPTPETTHTPEATPTSEATSTPEVTPMPEATPIPEATPTPGVPQTTPTPQVSTQSGTGSASQTPTNPGTGSASQTPTNPGTGSVSQTPTNPGTGSASQTPTNPGTDSASQTPTNSGTGTVPQTPTTPETGSAPQDTTSPSATPSAPVEKQLPVGTTLKGISGGNYRVTGTGSVEYIKPVGKRSVVTIPSQIKVKGVSYRVTSIAANAFRNNKKLKKVIIGSEIQKIGANAFCGCRNLKNICVETKKLKKNRVGKKAFSGISKKAIFRIYSSSKVKVYKMIFKSKGAPSKAKYIFWISF